MHTYEEAELEIHDEAPEGKRLFIISRIAAIIFSSGVSVAFSSGAIAIAIAACEGAAISG